MTRIVALGEIMGRLSPAGFQRWEQCLPGSLQVLFAGAEASVAMSIAHLGGDAAMVTALPDHQLGDACLAAIRARGVDTRHILRRRQGRLGLYFLEAGVNQRPGKVIYDREGSAMAITPPEAYDWDAILDGADWLVLSGITSAISRNGHAVALAAAEAAQRYGIPLLLDFNYRGKLWQWGGSIEPRRLAIESLRQLLPAVGLLVAGAEEIRELAGVDSDPPASDATLPTSTATVAAGAATTPAGAATPPAAAAESFAAAAAQLQQRYPNILRLASTYRWARSASQQRLGGMLCSGGKLYWAPRSTAPSPTAAVPPVAAPSSVAVATGSGGLGIYDIEQVVDRIGTGDAFTAALLFALTTAELADPQGAIEFATAAFCLAHSIEGDFHCSRREEIEALLAGGGAGRVQR